MNKNTKKALDRIKTNYEIFSQSSDKETAMKAALMLEVVAKDGYLRKKGKSILDKEV